MEALMSGDIDPLVPREASGLLGRTGTESVSPSAPAGRPRSDEIVPAERADEEGEAPVDPFDAAMGPGDPALGSGSRSED
jgi:hypothetical protein